MLTTNDLNQCFAQATQAHQQGRLTKAARLYRHILADVPHHAEAHHLLGLVYNQQGRHSEAVDHLQQAIALAPQNPTFLNNLGEVWRHQGHLDQATQAYRQALHFAPHQATTHYNLANLLKQQGHLAEAVTHYQQAIQLKPDYAKAHYNLGNVWLDQHQDEAAITAYRQAIALNPTLVDAHRNIGVVCERQGDLPTARRHYRQALWLEPDNRLFRLHVDTLCPPVPTDNAEIDNYRHYLRAIINRCRAEAWHFDISREPQVWGEPSIFLNSHPQDNLTLKRDYARIFQDCFPTTLLPAQAKKGASELVHLGFLLTRHADIFLKCLGGIINHFPTTPFRLTIACPPALLRRLRPALKQPAVEYLPLPPRFDHMVTMLRQARFDLLYHWEVGTDAINYFLPFCQLAPIQCTGWGWPVTSGIPQMDYFISSELLESEDADDHYTETLIRLPSLPAYYLRPPHPIQRRSRADFGFTNAQHLYLCLQHPRKFHPDFDPILAEILRRDPQGILVISRGRFPYLVDLLLKRWQTTMPDVIRQIRAVPWLDYHDTYLNLLALADVALDTLHFGSGLTAYDTLAVATPLVTLRGRFMRDRYTYGLYHKMGLLDCIATSVEAYIETALQLGTNPAYRADISAKIDQANPVIFEDTSIVNDLTDFFEVVLSSH